MTTTDVPATSAEVEPAARRSTVISVAGLATSILIAGLTVIPSPYAIGSAGPTTDTLGEADGQPVVSVSGMATYDTTGELRLTTVSVSRAGSQFFTLGRVLSAWASPEHYVRPQEEVFGEPDQEQAVQELSEQEWITSQESATVASLDALGIDVPAVITVAGVTEGSNAAGLLLEGDVITAIDGEPVPTYPAMAHAIDNREPGDPISVTVNRDGTEVTETFDSVDYQGEPRIGVGVRPEFEMPIDVEVAIEDVSGPSAGLMFSLGIMDKLTPEDELSGAKVAGTGTIDATGDVGPIGGIRMKLYGARDAGADWFLAPVENCSEVTGNVPEGLSVVAVDTLDDAYEAIAKIGAGDAADLPSC